MRCVFLPKRKASRLRINLHVHRKNKPSKTGCFCASGNPTEVALSAMFVVGYESEIADLFMMEMPGNAPKPNFIFESNQSNAFANVLSVT